MIDFTGALRGETTLADLTRDFNVDDWHRLTDEMIDEVQRIIADATDADVVFVPDDPKANDGGAPEGEQHIAWTLGHVVVHTTAGSEEGAAHASSLARGTVPEGRSRYEVPWQTMTTIAQVRARLEESRRMRHAFLNTWPDEPHLDLTMTLVPRFGPTNALARFGLGFAHEQGHLEQLREIMRQAREARNG